jgi:predicted RNA binding protein YcfA (HicA-like mRNA interferase family)
MPKSGKEVLNLFLKKGWIILRQKGSHVQIGKSGNLETIPMHKELAKGLERKLLKRLEED